MKLTKSNDNISFGTEFDIKFDEAPLTLSKGDVHVGDLLKEDYCLTLPNLTKYIFPDGIEKIIYTIPSLDTPVCECQIKELSRILDESDGLNVMYYVISVDTPFAQEKFIKSNNINENIIFLSDYAQHQFMNEMGLKIVELNIFARSTIKCNRDNTISSIVVSKDITQIP